MSYEEKIDKKIMIKSAILFIILQIVLNFGLSFLKIFDNEFVLNNANFFCYFPLFILYFVVYGKTLIQSIKKLKKEDFNYLGIWTFFTVIFMVAVAITVDKIGIINKNETKEIAQNYILGFITAVIFGSFIEEFVYRFFIFRSLERINKVLAHILAAFIFGFVHVWHYVLLDGDLTQLVSMSAYLIIGLGASTLYSKSKNICYPIFLHSLINLISMT